MEYIKSATEWQNAEVAKICIGDDEIAELSALRAEGYQIDEPIADEIINHYIK